MRRGIDTGGARTGFVYLGDGAGRVHKAPSTPRDPLEAIVTVPGGRAPGSPENERF
jgi:N-methylhydantoinase A/oxoprolinase/acetone carboxylase beta subunit